MANSHEEWFTVLQESKESQHIILSPGVGTYLNPPRLGTFLFAGMPAGTLKILNTYYELVIPEGISGRVMTNKTNHRDVVSNVEYGQELFRLNPAPGAIETITEKVLADATGENTANEEDGYVITAFTTGIFYAKPSPDAPPFVTVGQEIEKGKALGLIEVMKTFNHIVFHGTDRSHSGIIKKIYVQDAQEVKLGQPLFLIE